MVSDILQTLCDLELSNNGLLQLLSIHNSAFNQIPDPVVYLVQVLWLADSVPHLLKHFHYLQYIPNAVASSKCKELETWIYHFQFLLAQIYVLLTLGWRGSVRHFTFHVLPLPIFPERNLRFSLGIGCYHLLEW